MEGKNSGFVETDPSCEIAGAVLTAALSLALTGAGQQRVRFQKVISLRFLKRENEF